MPTAVRAAVSAGLGVAPEQVRVQVSDVGGGFGMKTGSYPEDVALALAARATATERIPAIDGKAASGTVPDWPAGKYNVILTKENGNWKIKDITLLEWIQND